MRRKATPEQPPPSEMMPGSIRVEVVPSAWAPRPFTQEDRYKYSVFIAVLLVHLPPLDAFHHGNCE